MTDFEEIRDSAASRRAFLTRMTAAGLGVAAMGLLAAPARATGRPLLDIVNVPDNQHFPGIPGRNKNEQVLNYALTLEILEADLYRQALNLAAGKDIATPLPDDTSGYSLSVDPGMLVPQFADLGFQYLVQFAPVEAAHRDFLRAAIQAGGGTPVSPNPGGYKAPFGNNLETILHVILAAEETGVRAYLGAAGAMTDLKLIQTAASIYSTEARHSAAIKMALMRNPDPNRHHWDSQVTPRQEHDEDFEFFMTPELVITSVKPFFA